MNRFLKTLLIWLLIAVVPLNAVAAAIGMSCGPGHQQAVQTSTPHGAVHGAHADASHDHAMAHDAASSHQLGVPVDTAPADAHDPSSHSTCSACSVFCIGAVAPPSVVVPLPAFSGSENVVLAAVPSVSGFIPEGPRRPPRTLSA